MEHMKNIAALVREVQIGNGYPIRNSPIFALLASNTNGARVSGSWGRPGTGECSTGLKIDSSNTFGYIAAMTIFIPADHGRLIAAFDHAARGLSIENNPAALTAFRQDYIAGLPWAQRDGWDCCAIDHLQGREWHWDWLQLWKRKFGALGAAPRMWINPRSASFHPKYQRQISIDRDVYLFSNTISASRKLFPRVGEYVRFYSPISDEHRDIISLESRMIEEYISGISNILPPFYPGCRTTFSFVTENNIKYHLKKGDKFLWSIVRD